MIPCVEEASIITNALDFWFYQDMERIRESSSYAVEIKESERIRSSSTFDQISLSESRFKAKTNVLDFWFYGDMEITRGSSVDGVETKEVERNRESSIDDEIDLLGSRPEAKTNALDFWFYQDMARRRHPLTALTEMIGRNCDRGSLILDGIKQERPIVEATTSAFDSWFYEDMKRIRDVSLYLVGEGHSKLNEIDEIGSRVEVTTNAFDFWFYQDMNRRREMPIDLVIMRGSKGDENPSNEIKEKGSRIQVTMNAFDFWFNQDMKKIRDKSNNDNTLESVSENVSHQLEDDSPTESTFFEEIMEDVETFDSEKAALVQKEFKPNYFWSNRSTSISFLASKRGDIKPPDVGLSVQKLYLSYPREETGCFLADIGRNPAIDRPSSLYCQHLVSANFIRPQSIALEYLNAKDDLDEDKPILDVIVDFFNVMRKARTQRRKEAKRQKQLLKKKQLDR